MGTYGLVRIAVPAAPDGMHALAPYLAAFAVTGIVYGSLVCLALVREGAGGDLKRLIAYSSIGHMGFVLLGIATLTASGINGALFANVAHGLITGLLFFVVGAVRARTGDTGLDRLADGHGAGLYRRAPRLGALLAFAAVASLGLPGLAGFWGELLAMLGAFHPADGLHRPLYLVCLALAGLGTLLTAAYLLLVVRRVCMGPAPGPAVAAAAEGSAGSAVGPGSAAPPASAASLASVPSPDTAVPLPAPEGTEKHGAAPATPLDADTSGNGAESAAATPGTTQPPGHPAAPGAGVGGTVPGVGSAPPGTGSAQPGALPDLRGPEYAAFLPLGALTLLLGLWPALLLDLTDPVVQSLLPGVVR